MDTRKLRNGKSFKQLQPSISIFDAEPVDIAADLDVGEFMRKAMLAQEEGRDEEQDNEEYEADEVLEKKGAEESNECVSGKKRTSVEQEHQQSYANRKRRKKRSSKYEKTGHLTEYNTRSGLDRASPKEVPTLVAENLPAAHGAYVGIDQKPPGRTVECSLEWFKSQGFEVVKWDGTVAKPIVEKNGRVLAVAVKKINNPHYQEQIDRAAMLIESACRETKFSLKETNHTHGIGWPAAAFGISFGKGQPRPRRLAARREMMEKLLSDSSFETIATSQSAAFAAWSPKNYHYYFERNKVLLELEPTLCFNFPRSVFACITVNFGPQTSTLDHTDSKNTAHSMCAMTSAGSYDYERGGHLVLWDLKILLEFPPGCTILLPSALLRHSNTPVQSGETRYSITQYTAGGIWRWLDAGGRTEVEIMANSPGEMAEIMARKACRWQWAVNMFSTLEELRKDFVCST